MLGMIKKGIDRELARRKAQPGILSGEAAAVGKAVVNPDVGIDKSGALARGYGALGSQGKAASTTGVRQNTAGFGQAQSGNTEQTALAARALESSQGQGQQQQLANMLMAQAQGTGGPSVAELQMSRGLGQAQNAAASQAASARGVNPALAARMAAMGQTNLANQNIENTGMLRAQEQMAAMQGAGAQLGTMEQQRLGRTALSGEITGQQRGQNLQQQQAGQGMMGIGAGMQQAGLGGQVGIQGTNAGIQNQQYLTGLQGIFGIKNTEAGKQDKSWWDTIWSDERTKDEEARLSGTQLDQFAQSLSKNFMQNPSRGIAGNAVDMGKGALIGKGLGLLFSDDRTKMPLDKFADTLGKGYQFEYKDKGMGGGPRMGVMAQDLVKDPVGKSMVSSAAVPTKGGGAVERMAIDPANALGAALATIGRLNERLNKLEGKRSPDDTEA